MTWLALAVLAGHTGVAFDFDPCVGDLTALVDLELGAGNVESGGALTAVARCEPGAVELEVREGALVRASRRVDRPASSRLLAIALAELVFSARAQSVSELPVRPTPRSPPAGVSPPPPDPKRWAGWLQAEGFLAFGLQTQLGVGFRLGAGRAVSRGIARFELAVEHAAAREPLGWLDQLLTSIILGADVRPWSAMPFEVGLAAKVGLASLAGRPDDDTLAEGFIRLGPFAAALVHAKARLADVDHPGPVVGLELGLVLVPFRGLRSDGTLWGCDGAWVAVTLGWEIPW